MINFTPIEAILGGGLIGLAAVLAMLIHGRIAGISGILGGALALEQDGGRFRYGFLAGLLLAPTVWFLGNGEMPDIEIPVPLWLLIAGGLLVGFGSGLGSGCTSGHGVCGVARLSRRSLAATISFIATGMLTVFVIRHILGVW